MTRSAPSMSSIVSARASSNEIRRYGSSSKRTKPWSAASCTSALRFSIERVQPAGLWKFGMTCARATSPSPHAASTAAGSTPSDSSGAPISSAPACWSRSNVRS